MMGLHQAYGVRAPSEKNGLISCLWLHLLKVGSILKTGANQS